MIKYTNKITKKRNKNSVKIINKSKNQIKPILQENVKIQIQMKILKNQKHNFQMLNKNIEKISIKKIWLKHYRFSD